MFRRGVFLVAGKAATTTAMLLGLGTCVSAQTTQVIAQVRDKPGPPGVVAPTNASVPETLATYLDKVEWNPSSQGPLLIVSPAATTWTYQTQRSPDGGVVRSTRPAPPTPDASGGYTLAAIAGYFDRKIVPYPSIAVYAPMTMTRLVDRRLPKPDGYGALSNSDKARLLESTFTADQWQRLASPDGIGAGDMNGEQRELYLSLLPEPFVLDPAPVPSGTQAASTATGNPPVTLSDDQRAAVRLSVHKQLDWSYKMGKNGIMYTGGSASAAAGVAYQLRYSDRFQNMYGRADLFGVSLTEVEPNRPKPSELPEELSGSSKPVSLADATTLGDLVHRIAQATGAELYADPRYAVRTLYVRGASANAGDLLRALALAVTGTWRHLGPAYVLTDDLEGLGVRHARIADWVGQNGLLMQLAQEQADAALSGVHVADLAPWSDSDPLRPDSALVQKIDAAKQQGASLANMQANLFVTMGELPAAAQSAIGDQLKQYQENQQRMAENLGNSYVPEQPLNTDGVNVIVRTRSQYLVPGIGEVASPEIQNALNDTGRYYPAIPRQTYRPNPSNIKFPQNCPVRALLIAPHTAQEIVDAARAARRCGFTQLWVQTSRADTTLLPVAVQQASANQLTFQAVVPLLRATAAEPPSAIDRNIIGKSTTEYARQERGAVKNLNVPDAPVGSQGQANAFGGATVTGNTWRSTPAVDQLIDRGDYLRSDDLDVQRALIADLGKIASIPGLGGLVLRDAVPAGYGGPTQYNGVSYSYGQVGVPPIRDPLLALGYSPSMRLKALRQFGCDPIDLSPLPDGDFLQAPGSYGVGPHIGLPFFPDAGEFGRFQFASPTKAMDASKLAAKSWLDLRAGTNTALLQAVAAGLRAQSPGIAIYSSSETQASSAMGGFWFGSVDPPGSAPATPPTSASLIAPTGPVAVGAHVGSQRVNAYDPVRDRRAKAKAGSKTSFFCVAVDPIARNADDADTEALTLLMLGLGQAANWDGVVVDMTTLAPARAATLLQALPDAPATTP